MWLLWNKHNALFKINLPLKFDLLRSLCQKCSHTLQSTCSPGCHAESYRNHFWQQQSLTTCLSACEFMWVTQSSVKLHPTDWHPNICGCLYSTYFHNIACYQMKFYHFSELDEQLTLREMKHVKNAAFSKCWFEWPDSNHAKTDTGGQQLYYGHACRLMAWIP